MKKDVELNGWMVKFFSLFSCLNKINCNREIYDSIILKILKTYVVTASDRRYAYHIQLNVLLIVDCMQT